MKSNHSTNLLFAALFLSIFIVIQHCQFLNTILSNISSFSYGICDEEINKIIYRNDRFLILQKDISSVFIDGPISDAIYPISKEEEYYLIMIIREKFGYTSDNFRYYITIRNGGVKIIPVDSRGNITMDSIQFDRCGNLVGDNYNTRIKYLRYK